MERNKDAAQTKAKGRKRHLPLWRGLFATSAMLTPAVALAEREYNLQTPVTPIATQIFDLHLLITGICAIIFVAVFSVMFYSIFAHRKSKGHPAAQFHENTTVEVIWTVIPFLILLLMAFPATRTILAMKDASVPDMTVKVTGFQWKWQYDYLDHGFSYVSNLKTPSAQIHNLDTKDEHYLLDVDQPMVVPTGKKVRVLITAGDVIHSWWVPAFGVKQDAIPGFVRDSWFKADNARHLSRAVRRALRQGARLHAHRGRGQDARGLRTVGRRAEEKVGCLGRGYRQGVGSQGPRGSG